MAKKGAPAPELTHDECIREIQTLCAIFSDIQQTSRSLVPLVEAEPAKTKRDFDEIKKGIYDLFEQRIMPQSIETATHLNQLCLENYEKTFKCLKSDIGPNTKLGLDQVKEGLKEIQPYYQNIDLYFQFVIKHLQQLKDKVDPDTRNASNNSDDPATWSLTINPDDYKYPAGSTDDVSPNNTGSEICSSLMKATLELESTLNSRQLISFKHNMKARKIVEVHGKKSAHECTKSLNLPEPDPLNPETGRLMNELVQRQINHINQAMCVGDVIDVVKGMGERVDQAVNFFDELMIKYGCLETDAE